MGPKLQWVFSEGAIRHILCFKDVSKSVRPEALCPECNRPLILKFGEIRVPHAAHKSGDICSATNPETALHINAKFHLAQEFRKTSNVKILRRCKNSDHKLFKCAEINETLWELNWTGVEVERKVGTRKPDILLLSKDAPVGAVEIRVTHKVGKDKIIDLKTLSLPWLETKGDDILPSNKKAWHTPQTFPITKEGGHEPWECDSCRKKRESEEQRIAHERELKEQWAERMRQAEERRLAYENSVGNQRPESKRQYESLKTNHKTHLEEQCLRLGRQVRYYLFVDHFFKSGERFREVFSFFEDIKGGNTTAYGYSFGENECRILYGPVNDAGRLKLQEFFRKDSRRFQDAQSLCHPTRISKKDWMDSNPLTFSESAYPPQCE